MNTPSIKNLLVLVLVTLVIFTALQATTHAVTDEEIASIGLAVDSGTTVTGQPDSAAPPTLTGILGRLILSLGAVFALMAGVLWVARRYFPQSIKSVSRGASIDILASRALGQRRQLLMVRAQGKTILLGVTPQSIQCLTEFDEEPMAWDAAAVGAGLDTDMNDAKSKAFESPGTPDMGDL